MYVHLKKYSSQANKCFQGIKLKGNVLDNEYYLKLSTSYQRAEILIIDDLFKDKVKKNRLVGELTEADMKHIYPIINYRYFNKLPIYNT